MVNVLPLPVCPYASTVALYPAPSPARLAVRKPTRLYCHKEPRVARTRVHRLEHCGAESEVAAAGEWVRESTAFRLAVRCSGVAERVHTPSWLPPAAVMQLH
jgi:hypothetical protein